ncbi:MAG: hypothetical protein AB7O43_16645 [Hyphomicrobiaceae bacterium]
MPDWLDITLATVLAEENAVWLTAAGWIATLLLLLAVVAILRSYERGRRSGITQAAATPPQPAPQAAATAPRQSRNAAPAPRPRPAPVQAAPASPPPAGLSQERAPGPAHGAVSESRPPPSLVVPPEGRKIFEPPTDRVAAAARDLANVVDLASRRPITENRRPPAVPPGQSGIRRSTDNLMRIRGIGPLIEQRLTALGVTRLHQIASWDAAEVERIEAALGLNGRVVREQWVEQARILAGGGETEFSRRIDRETRYMPER